jgi:hypothetical protein
MMLLLIVMFIDRLRELEYDEYNALEGWLVILLWVN